MKRRIQMFVGAILVLTVAALSVLFSVAHVSTSVHAASTPLPKNSSVSCTLGLTNEGWHMSSKGGYVGNEAITNPNNSAGQCDGSYTYYRNSVGTTANWSSPYLSSFGGQGYVWVYFPANRAGATIATYNVKTDIQQWSATVSQRSTSGWYRLGKFSTHGRGVNVSVTTAQNSQGDLLVDAIALQFTSSCC